jgi:DNA-binding CsgD family transcriptional regulator
MAKTLFFIEALLFAALVVVFPLISSEAAAAFIAPAGLSLVLPLACAMAVSPPRAVIKALGSAFSTGGPGTDAAEHARILAELGAFSRASAVLGLLFALASLCSRLPASRGTWTLLGIYLSAYALLNAMLWRILAAVVLPERSSGPELRSGPEQGNGCQAFASAHGLTPREWETAALIAEGRSYKETAFELGISIKTVKAHMSRVYEKTGAASNVGLALKIRAEGGPPAGGRRP